MKTENETCEECQEEFDPSKSPNNKFCPECYELLCKHIYPYHSVEDDITVRKFLL